MKKVNILIIIAVIVIANSACEKFSDGGPIRKADKNLQNSWELHKYNRNGTNETSLIFISGYSEEYSGGGVYSRTYINNTDDLVSETGNWSWRVIIRLYISLMSAAYKTFQKAIVLFRHLLT